MRSLLALLSLVVLFAPSLARAAALDEKLARVPLLAGSYRVFEGAATTSTNDGFVRVGPGGHSLILESDLGLQVLTHDAVKGAYVLDRYLAAPGEAAHLEGTLDGKALTFAAKTTVAGKKVRLTWSGDSDGGVTVREESGSDTKKWTPVSSRRWVRTRRATAGHATGIGGVFFKANDSKKLREWYKDQLGMTIAPDGGWIDVSWRELDDPSHVAHTVWATFKKETTHFDGLFMINYRVDDLEALLTKLKAAGVTVERTEDEPGNGRFAWIRDAEGNLVELWEPPADG